jgi:hypothetical protein
MFMTARARFFFRLLIALAGAAQAFPALADDSAAAPDSVFAYILVACVAAATIVAFLMIRSALYNSTWSLSDALSEEADIGIDKDGKPFLGPDGKPVVVSELRASTSRFIALFGLIGILMMYVGFGLVTLKIFASGKPLPDPTQVKEITTFLFAGLTMFAPYIVNKFASIFDWLKPKTGA